MESARIINRKPVGKYRWLQHELDALKTHWPDMETVAMITGRSEESVRHKGYMMGYRTERFGSCIDRAIKTQRRKALNWAIENRITGRVISELTIR